MIEQICQQCGKVFLARPNEVNRGRVKYCSTKCQYEARRKRVTRICENCCKEFEVPSYRMASARFCSKECHKAYKQLIPKVCPVCNKTFSVHHYRNKTAKYCSLECKLRANRPIIKICEYCGKQFSVRPSVAQIARFCSRKCQTIGQWRDPEYRANVIEAHKKSWQDPEFVKRMIAAFHNKPTKPEKQLEVILDRHFPQFKYNGDGSLGIGLAGLIPDFVNINGRKEVIEVFGDYWHSPHKIGNKWKSSELGATMAYSSVGFKCLVIWQHELKELTEEQLVDKIGTFFRGKARSKLRLDKRR